MQLNWESDFLDETQIDQLGRKVFKKKSNSRGPDRTQHLSIMTPLRWQGLLYKTYILFRQLEERDILEILYQMVSAIRHMHEHDVLHRLVKF